MTTDKLVVETSLAGCKKSTPQDTASYHWGSFVFSSPKMQQLLTQHEALHAQENEPTPVTKKTPG